MFKKLFVLALVLVLLGYVGAEVWVNNYAETAIARKLKEDHPQASAVQARVSIPVLWSLLTSGRIRRVGVTAEHVAIAQVPVANVKLFASKADVELTGVDIDRDALLQRQELLVESIDHMNVRVEISQAEASKVLSLVPGLEFEFLPGVVRLKIAGAVIGGRFEVIDGTRLRFVPGSVGPLPSGLAPGLDLTTLPFATCTQKVSIRVEQGRMVITCSQNRPPIPQ